MTTGTARPHELRQLAEAYPEDIFPTPPEEHRAFDAVAADVLRRAAVPHYLTCADRIEELESAIREHEHAVRSYNDMWAGEDGGSSIADMKLWSVLGEEESADDA